jgi:NAD(P)-dependent dehydrogenase (short-subunit alcohol dehydrogenase family)
MGRLDGRVAIVTGAGQGLGRAHALRLADDGAAVVVNDVDGDAAAEVVGEIAAAGGQAVAGTQDVTSWDAAGELVALAVETFGELHVLVNNAGIVRDRTLVSLAEDEWDAVIAVHLKGHAAPTHHAMAHWRARSKAGREVRASLVHTSSVAAFVGNLGQAAYSAAKAGLTGLMRVAALEGARYGVRSNAVSPSARTRLTLAMPGSEDRLRAPDDPGAFDFYAPGNVSPLIAWLAEADCPANSQVFHIGGSRLFVMELPKIAHLLERSGPWTADALDAELADRLVEPMGLDVFLVQPPKEER